ncbi:hypothetical protein [Glycomyces sp. NPDC047010]|uniref:hypothetical protein n=1 Tax=Glycomyces sp. NPDC047010 TaxID=3155023 RepID=UPI0033E99441
MTAIDPAALARRRYRLGARMFTAAVRWLRWWLLAALALAVLGGPVIHLIWDADAGAWTGTISVLQWFTAITGGVFLHNSLTGLISRGVTRREITVAFLVFGALASAALAALAITGFAVEHFMLGLVAAPDDTWGQVLAKGARYLLIGPAYFFAGALVTAAAARIGKEGAFVVVLFLLFPSMLIAGTLSLEFFGYTVDAFSWQAAAWIGSGLAFIAAMVTALVLVLRSVPVPKRGG